MKKSMSESGIGPPQTRKIQTLLGVLFLAVTGWKVAGSVPDIPKFVLVLAPHTSNWDLPFILAVMYALGLKINWFGKKELFAAPFGGVLKWFPSKYGAANSANDTGTRANCDRYCTGRDAQPV